MVHAGSLPDVVDSLPLQSPHRTFDPEEADFFYVPVYVNTLTWPVFAWADGPWYGGLVYGAPPPPPPAHTACPRPLPRHSDSLCAASVTSNGTNNLCSHRTSC